MTKKGTRIMTSEETLSLGNGLKSKVIWTTGASGVGKTTINDELQRRFESKGYKVERLNDVSRSVCSEMGITSPKELRTDTERYFQFQSSVLMRQIEWDTKALVDLRDNPNGSVLYLSDRFVTCYAGFAMVYGREIDANEYKYYSHAENDVLMEWYRYVVPALVDRQAVIAFVHPLEGEVQPDGVRPTNRLDQIVTSYAILYILLKQLAEGELLSKHLTAELVQLTRVNSAALESLRTYVFGAERQLMTSLWRDAIVFLRAAENNVRVEEVEAHISLLETMINTQEDAQLPDGYTVFEISENRYGVTNPSGDRIRAAFISRESAVAFCITDAAKGKAENENDQ
jgi:hypothetical protein